MEKKFLSLAVSLLLLSCKNPVHQEEKKPAPVEEPGVSAKENFERGKIIKQVAVLGNGTQTYALYLPQGYNEQGKFPVIVFFDPHARGFHPLELYSGLAEQYGYILVGSNNSKNGLAPEETQTISDNLISDIKQRFATDPNRIITSGFSGGARVASSVAIYSSGIRGVIACGAGFPAVDPSVIQNNFTFVGIAGSDDFNNAELKKLDESLATTAIKHQLLLFEGAHDWCPKEVMDEAITFLRFTAMKEGLVTKNDSMINAYRGKEEHLLHGFLENKKMMQALYSCNKLINYLDGLQNISNYVNTRNTIQKDPRFREEMAEQKKIQQEELEKQQYYSNALLSQDLSWWKKELMVIEKNSAENNKDNVRLMYKRLKGFLGVAVYSYSARTIKTNDFNNAPKLVALYKTIEPDNTEAWYLSACLNSKRRRTGEAFADLDSAISKGFNDSERMINDSDLQLLQQDERFNQLAGKMH